MHQPLADTIRSLEFRHIGRTLLHSLTIGAIVGAVACAFFLLLEGSAALMLERFAGYQPLRPAGEVGVPFSTDLHRPFLPWLLLLVPAIGGLAAGLVAHFWAPEVMGGGGDAFIEAFHRHRGHIRKRVPLAKIIASVCSLGSGGSGGREGPTMQIGAALGSLLSGPLRLSARDRRILLVAGTAAGISAIFRTPLGAALFAVEVLYRNDFESDALVPAILASVTAYSIFSAVFPSAGPLFAHAPRYLVPPRHLPLYALMAVGLSLAALLFLSILRLSKRSFDALPLPRFLRPALGGLLLGILATVWIVTVNPHLHLAAQGAGLLGSGYGAAQGAISGATWVPAGWGGVQVLMALVLAKMVATALTIGSGGSAGDFGPSIAIGGLIGGAFGRIAQLTIDPSLDPGAFALVGMGTFYGGLAHTPVSSLVMVCEMAGSYDLLVPLMLAEGVALLVLRRSGLYDAQVSSRFDSPAHAADATLDVLRILRVGEVVTRNRPFATFAPAASVKEIVRVLTGAAPWQDAFPVIGPGGQLAGLLSGDDIRTLLAESGLEHIAVAADVMVSPVTVSADEDLHVALERLLESGLRQLPVVDSTGGILGFLGHADIARAYHEDIARRGEDSVRELRA